MTTIVWFRNDLRTIDHEPLYRAAQQGQVVPLYCFDPRSFGKTHYFGFPKTAGFRAQFLRESVADLAHRLAALGAPLIIRWGNPETIVAEVVRATQATALYYHAEVASEEIAVEVAVRNALAPLGIHPQAFWGHTLYHRDDLPFSIPALPDIFTTYRHAVEERSTIRQSFPAPMRLEGVTLPSDGIPTLAAWEIQAPPADPRAVLPFVGGESAGLARLHRYLWEDDRLRDYKNSRNGMVGEGYSTKFSPWLADGSLSPRTIYENVQAYEKSRIKNESTYWLIFELLWRDYFRFVLLKYGNLLFQAGGLRQLALPRHHNWAWFEAWREGRTGYPLVDATMRELGETGYISNRGRQNVASFLTKNLGLDWRMGAEWFESLLIDYDVASNYGNWNYAAGVGNDPRAFRFFNIFKQAEQYDPTGEYVKRWLPQLAPLPDDKVHRPSDLTAEEQQQYGVEIGKTYPPYLVPLYVTATANEAIYKQALADSTKAR